MKADLHPKSQFITVSCSCGHKLISFTTLTEDYSVETCSKCHSQWTGEKKELRTSRVKSFNEKYKNIMGAAAGKAAEVSAAE